MTTLTFRRLLALLAALSLLAAACGSDDDDDTAADDAADGEAASSADDGGGLADVCPSPLVIQTDWFPESEHGALYNMIGDDYTVDVDAKVVRGSLVDGGEPTGIDFEVRTGGPAIGSAPVASYVYTDDSIHLAYANTESQALNFADAPLLSVVAPLEQNPQIIMWDPETYPEVETLADLGAAGVTINVFGGGVFSEVFVAQGIWSADQIDPSYDGSPARFVAEGGAIAQQGFASAEPHNYENVFEEWGRPVRFQTLHDAGFEVYSQTVAIRPADQDELDACLTEVVPIIQRSVVDFYADPDRANAIIIDAVEQYADFWVYDEALATYSVDTQIDLGLVGNGPNDTVGDMETDRIEGVIASMTDAGMDMPQVTAEDLFTNEYIDPAIGF